VYPVNTVLSFLCILQESLLFNFLVHKYSVLFRTYFYKKKIARKSLPKIYLGQDMDRTFSKVGTGSGQNIVRIQFTMHGDRGKDFNYRTERGLTKVVAFQRPEKSPVPIFKLNWL
jgi:hypothetical protein